VSGRRKKEEGRRKKEEGRRKKTPPCPPQGGKEEGRKFLVPRLCLGTHI